MIQKRYSVQLTGETGLLMHHDNLSWAETMKKWAADPGNRSKSVAGDDRTPPHRWIGCLYHEFGVVVIPSDNLMTVLREGGARCPTGKKGATFKRQTQSGIVVDQSAWPLLINGEKVPMEPILALTKLEGEPDELFPENERVARSLGFELFVKRAKIGKAKHVRVRPRFNQWSCAGSVTVLDETITKDVLQNILTHAGAFAGIGDWRPSSPMSPGPWGKFTAVVKPL